MTEAQRAALKERVAAWQRAAPVLQEVRDDDIREADTIAAIESMTLLFRDAVKNFPPGPTSGLVEQQSWFAKLRRS